MACTQNALHTRLSNTMRAHVERVIVIGASPMRGRVANAWACAVCLDGAPPANDRTSQKTRECHLLIFNRRLRGTLLLLLLALLLRALVGFCTLDAPATVLPPERTSRTGSSAPNACKCNELCGLGAAACFVARFIARFSAPLHHFVKKLFSYITKT